MAAVFGRLALPSVLFLSLLVATIILEERHFRDLPAGRFGFGLWVLPYMTGVGAAIAGGLLVDRLIKLFFWDFAVARVTGRTPPKLLVQIGTILPYLGAAMAAVGLVFNQSIVGLFATTGAVGVVVALALRSIILDAFSGVAMNLDEPFRVGDWIEFASRGGSIVARVEEMHWRTTRLRNRDDNAIVVPNSELGAAVITNLSRPTSHTEIAHEVTLDHSLPTERVINTLRSAMMAAVIDHPGFPKGHAPTARVSGINGLGVQYTLSWTIDIAKISPFTARHYVLRRVLDYYRNAGLQPAVPKYDVYQAALSDRILKPTIAEHRYTLISRVELFASLDAEELRDLAASLVVRRFDEADWLMRTGEPGDSMYVVTEGLLHVYIKPADGDEERRVAQIVPGNFFGEMSLLTGEPRSASIRAATDSICFEITKDTLTRLFARRPDLARRISRKVARRQLRNDASLAAKSEAEQEARAQTFAAELFARMRRFFGKVIGGQEQAAPRALAGSK